MKILDNQNKRGNYLRYSGEDLVSLLDDAFHYKNKYPPKIHVNGATFDWYELADRGWEMTARQKIPNKSSIRITFRDPIYNSTLSFKLQTPHRPELKGDLRGGLAGILGSMTFTDKCFTSNIFIDTPVKDVMNSYYAGYKEGLEEGVTLAQFSVDELLDELIKRQPKSTKKRKKSVDSVLPDNVVQILEYLEKVA